MKPSPFRAIRQKLFHEGKLLRYLTYAIGEIALIIIGIMLALQLNNWNESHKAQQEFEIYISQLTEDVRTAIAEIEVRTFNAEKGVQEKLLLMRIIEGEEAKPEDLETMKQAIRIIGRFQEFDINVGLLGELLNGNLDAIVQDRDLTRQVMEVTRKVKENLRILEEKQRSVYSNNEIFDRYRGRNHPTLPELPLRYDLERMKSSPEFLYTLHNDTHAYQVRKVFGERIKETLSDFLVLLEEYE